MSVEMRGFEKEGQQSCSILNRIQVNLKKYAFGYDHARLTPTGVFFYPFFMSSRE
jgi:hypothetical protein